MTTYTISSEKAVTYLLVVGLGIHVIRKKGDYVYGKCQYKILSIKSHLRVNEYERNDNRQNLNNVSNMNKEEKSSDKFLSTILNFPTNWQ